MFVLTRVTGVFLFTPVLTSAVIPRKYKALFAFMFALAVFPQVSHLDQAADLSLDLPSIGVVMFSELMIGVVLGLIAGLPMLAIQMAGFIMGYQMGLGLAQAYNPEMDGSDDVVSQLLFFMGMAVYLAAGGLDLVFLALLGTFDNVPIGAFAASQAPLDLYVGLLSSGVELAIRIAAPVMGVILMALLSMGFVMKTMPQINILSVGFAAKILAGLSILAIVVGAIDFVIHEETLATLHELLIWTGVRGAE